MQAEHDADVLYGDRTHSLEEQVDDYMERRRDDPPSVGSVYSVKNEELRTNNDRQQTGEPPEPRTGKPAREDEKHFHIIDGPRIPGTPRSMDPCAASSRATPQGNRRPTRQNSSSQRNKGTRLEPSKAKDNSGGTKGPRRVDRRLH